MVIGACGLTCSECEAYRATQANDPEAIEQVAAKWRVEYGAAIETGYVWCDGCMEPGERKCAHAASGCNIRACAISKGVANCAFCSDFACESITAFFAEAPGTRDTLEAIRRENAIWARYRA